MNCCRRQRIWVWFAGLQDQRLDRERALAALARLGLLAEAHTACCRLSAGQQRRAAIARWLLAGASAMATG